MIGGHAVFCHELSARQAKLGLNIEVFTSLRGGLSRHEMINTGYLVSRLKSVWMPWDSLGMSNPFTPSLYGGIRERNCDLVDVHGHLFWMTALSVKAALDAGKPVVATVHGLFALRDWLTNLSQKLYISSVGTWLLRNSTRVIALTHSDAKELANLGVRKRNLRVIPIAIDPNQFKPRESKPSTIVWAGRLVPEKGLETFLEALAGLRGARIPRLIIVGAGPMKKRLVHLVTMLDISAHVSFRQEVARSEVAKLLGESEIFVLSSLKEGLPMILLEAMAAGNMIIASSLPSIREVVGEAGMYFKPRDSAELASLLSSALSDRELRRRKGRIARKVVEQKFTWDVVLPMLEDLYGEVASS